MNSKSADQESNIMMESVDSSSQTFEMLEEDYPAAELNTKVASPIVKLDNLQSNRWWQPNVSTYLLPKILHQIPTEENISSDVNCSSNSSPSAGTKIKIINYKYECDHCNLKTITTERFWQHLFRCHIKKEKNVSKHKEYSEIDSHQSININKQVPLMYSCLYCDFRASFENRLRLHVFDHFRFICSECSLQCTDIKSLLSHLRRHSNQKFHLSLRSYNEKSVSKMKLHTLDHKEQIKDHKGQIKDHKRQIKDHKGQIKDHKGQIKDHKGQMKYPKYNKKREKASSYSHLQNPHQVYRIKCLYCRFTCFKNEEMEIHVKIHLRKPKNLKLKDSISSYKRKTISKDKNLTLNRQVVKCPKCKKKFRRRRIFCHLEKIHQTYRIKCLYCRFMCFKKRDMEIHVSRHLRKPINHKLRTSLKLRKQEQNGEVVECPKCKEKIKKISLFSHLVKIHEIYRIKCLYCRFMSFKQKDMETHVKTHLNSDELLKCSKCEFQSYEHGTFKFHILTHNFDLKRTSLLKNPLPDPVKRNDTKKLKCSSCIFETKNERDFKFHQLKEHFFDGVERKFRKEKLDSLHTKEEKLEYLWCYIYATNKRLKKKPVWDRMQTILDERGIAESVKFEFLIHSWRIRLLNEWKTVFASELKSIKKEVDEFINDKCLSVNDGYTSSESARKNSKENTDSQKIHTEDLLEVLWCYLYVTHNVFLKKSGSSGMRELLIKRGVLKKIRINSISNKKLSHMALSILHGKTQVTLEQITDVMKSVVQVLMIAGKCEDGEYSEDDLFENYNEERISSKESNEDVNRDWNDMDTETADVKIEPTMNGSVEGIFNDSEWENKFNEQHLEKEVSEIDIKIEPFDEID
ncbi:UNVERIFIED_CONTAM: hypothetical protein RMT77_015194 [Armadillidium vulgare]